MIFIDKNSSVPLYGQIYNQIKKDIMSGVYPVGSVLTPTRVLAKELCLSRNTVENAYNNLVLEGYVYSKQGAGYIVEDIYKYQLSPPKVKKTEKYHWYVSERPFKEKAAGQPKILYDFKYENLPIDLFPFSLWRKYTSSALLGIDVNKLTSYNEQEGEPDLRKELRKYLHRQRGVNCTVDQIVICCGIQDSIDRICYLLPKEYRSLGFDEPGHQVIREVFERNNYNITSLPVYPEYDYFDVLDQSDVRIVFTTPSHQFPVGYHMSITERLRLLSWAEKNNGIIIEDDYDSEFRYRSQPIPSIQSIDNSGSVIYIGTFSKVFAPGLRLSYMVLPEFLAPYYKNAFANQYTKIPWLNQKVMALYMQNGHFERHIRKCCNIYREKYECIMHSIQIILKDRVQIIGSDAGFHILLWVPEAKSEEWLITRAAEKGVKVYPTNHYWLKGEKNPGNTLLIGFANLHNDQIVKGIHLLNEAWFNGDR
ncbi:MAG TPA: PLP-dependent aminotransferase family protein [Desulfitobacteriaceae bacterium]|nr:PLP-dependent aminotransferase family protein [Desulfitobacteriaceae bacterium]